MKRNEAHVQTFFLFLFIQTWQREARTRTRTSYVVVGTSKYTRGQVEKKRGGVGWKVDCWFIGSFYVHV